MTRVISSRLFQTQRNSAPIGTRSLAFETYFTPRIRPWIWRYEIRGYAEERESPHRKASPGTTWTCTIRYPQRMNVSRCVIKVNRERPPAKKYRSFERYREQHQVAALRPRFSFSNRLWYTTLSNNSGSTRWPTRNEQEPSPRATTTHANNTHPRPDIRPFLCPPASVRCRLSTYRCGRLSRLVLYTRAGNAPE